MEDGHDFYVPDADCPESIDAWAAGLWRLDECTTSVSPSAIP